MALLIPKPTLKSIKKKILLNHVQAFICKKGQDRERLEGDLVTEFVEKVACESNKRFASAGPLIWDVTRTPIEWHIYLLQSPLLPKLTKDSQYLISNQAMFSHWVEVVAALWVVKSQATAAAKAQNHTLSVIAAQNANSSRRRNQGSSNKPNHYFSPSVFKDSVELHMENLYKETFPTKIMIANFQSHADLGSFSGESHSSFFFLSLGVLINLPPASLHYLNLISKKQRLSSSLSSTSEMCKILLELLANKKK
ncbi:hypothetical protein VP01_2678g1 [Puccinia sorghi]|uniref:Uncharacterized protein n=1 Tax=Puccinia sorghi TaxID=27349 RepID=A0A0L6V4L2_9BASI|nr:hypothetical protein VP01_2678g1 [Puccinia sorghi]